MLLALFAFRRGAGVAAMLVVLCVPMGFAHAQAADVEGTLWRRPDQVAAKRMESGETAYRSGEFEKSQQAYDGLPGADAQYNLGNTLAKQGRYEEAIAAYDRALRAQPGMEDAIANRRAVEAAMKRKPPSGNSERKDPRSQDKQDQKDQQQASGQDQQQPQQQPSQQPQSAQQPQQQSQSQKSQQQKQAQSQPDKPTDAQAQRAADAAQRQRMQQALQKEQKQKQTGKQTAQKESPQDRERRLANEAWLRRVPDDPGGLLRAKFRLEYERRQLEGGE
jgi:Ca-activated chloride channel family protein